MQVKIEREAINVRIQAGRFKKFIRSAYSPDKDKIVRFA
jgi:hypothetical protein